MRMGNRGCGQFIMCCLIHPSSSYSSHVPAWGPSVGDISTWASLMVVLPTGCNSSQIDSVWIPHRVTSPESKLAPVWDPISPPSHRSCKESAPSWTSHGLHSSTCSNMGSPRGCSWTPAPPSTFMGCIGQPTSPWSLPHAVFCVWLFCNCFLKLQQLLK